MTDNYIGLISGTSMDGIDAALVSFEGSSVTLIATHEHNYPTDLRQALLRATQAPQTCTVDAVGELDQRVGACFRDAANAVAQKSGVDSNSIRAIGSHGQTLRHQPDAAHPFTLQIGDPAVIAAGTRITTVADFRRADIARGGQGAPLAPAFHEFLLRDTDKHRVVLNIGGIGNVTVLPANSTDVTGFDTGPGNTLLDAWIRMQRGENYDRNGEWASSGVADEALLERLLMDPYFQKPAPKSTGPEHFNLEWLATSKIGELAAVDVQASLLALTARSIASAIGDAAPATSEMFVCGGGIHNGALMHELRSTLPEIAISSTADVGLDPDWVEAAAFAWLAMRTLQGLPGNLPAVTGASQKAILGAIYPA